MAEQSGSVQFQALLESALRTYEKSAGITLGDLEHPLAMQLQSCHSVDDMTALFQDQALQTVDEFRPRHRIVESIKATVSTLTTFSSGVSNANNVGHVRQAALMFCFTFQIDFTDIIRTWENIYGRSRYST